tara:strand:- start:4717 stop:4992 length:276 start_codon:yes stop_codon:yes gene_type:complete
MGQIVHGNALKTKVQEHFGCFVYNGLLHNQGPNVGMETLKTKKVSMVLQFFNEGVMNCFNWILFPLQKQAEVEGFCLGNWCQCFPAARKRG